MTIKTIVLSSIGSLHTRIQLLSFLLGSKIICLKNLAVLGLLSLLIREARTFETSGTNNHLTQRNIPEDLNPQHQRCENCNFNTTLSYEARKRVNNNNNNNNNNKKK